MRRISIARRRLVVLMFASLLMISLTSSSGRLARPLGSVDALRLGGTNTAEWQKRAPFPFRLQEHSVVTVNGKVHVLGGLLETPAGTVQASTTHKVYDPRTNSWSDAAPLPAAIHHVPATAIGNRIYALGGFELATFNAIDAVYIYDTRTDRWTSGARLTRPRGAGSAAVINGKIYVAGGARGGAPVRDFAMYDPGKNQWFELAPMPATARDHGAAAAVDGKFYMFGGRNQSTFTLALTEIYDPATGAWQSAAPMPTGRSGIAAVAMRGCIFVFGGEGNYYQFTGTFDKTEVYDPQRDVWYIAESMPTGRHGLLAGTLGSTVYLPAGADTMWFGPTDVHEAYTPPQQYNCQK